MEQADVVISWGFAPVPEEAKAAFARPTKFIALPTPQKRAYSAQVSGMFPSPIRYAVTHFLPGVQPLRVACLGFSESCHGVRNLLNSADGANFDAAIAIDGVHTAYGPNKSVDPNGMKPWLEFAKYAVGQTNGTSDRLLAITHSSIVPPNFVSTTATADWLWHQFTTEAAGEIPAIPPLVTPPASIHVGSPPASHPYNVEYPEPDWQPGRRFNGLIILGCNNRDIPAGYADHIYQARVILPAVVTGLLAERWNANDPGEPKVWA